MRTERGYAGRCYCRGMEYTFDHDPYTERFREEFVDPDNAAFPLDREDETGYAWQSSRWSTEDALVDQFEHELSEDQIAELADELNGEYPYWAKRSDLENIAD